MEDTRLVNALSIDVEDYYQVSAFDSVVGFEAWDDQPSRLEANVAKVLSVLAEEDVRATFFVLAWTAERFPGVVEKIHRAGHEIATHGYAHRLIYRQNPDGFRSDVQRSLDVIQGITGEELQGYRAPSFSIVEETLWAIDALQELGLRYDSSIFPARPLVHNRYGFPGSPREPYQIREDFWEFPMSTFRFLGRDFPVAGGGWLRHYPYLVTRWGIRRINAAGRPVIAYVHPWELDPDQPRVNGSRWRQFLHYRNLEKTEARLRALCQDFRFAPVREVLDNWIGRRDYDRNELDDETLQRRR
jgi:polysaccharide deacetylase family protein (PEP-CTERM system associated)